VTELAGHVAAIRDVVNIPMLVDADTGFGNAINARRA
jgi:2-methylisocitrate lyase-like PEP mutase family enzyme